MTAPELKGVATLDIANFRRNVGKVRGDLRDITDYAKKNGTLALTLKLSGTSLAAAKAQIDAAVGGRNLPFKVTFDPSSVRVAVAALRTTLTSVTSINTSALTAVQTQVNGQIAQLTALIAQLRALGGGGGGGGAGGRRGAGLSAGTQVLLNDLEKLNQEYKRGDVDANQYATRLAGLQSALRVAAATATAGTAEFRALDRAVTATVQGMRGIETARITSLKTELSGARAQFDAAAAAATNLAQRRAAIAAYEGDLSRIRVALQGMATSGRLTEQQLGAVNRMLAQTARESQTIKGKVNIGGLSGNIGNALQQLTGYVPGMAQLGGVINSLPPGLLAAAAGATALAAGLAASFKTAADFQQEMANINALTRPTGEELKTLTNTALNFGIPLGVGARAAAAGILELNKAGLSAQQVIGGGLSAALNLAAAAGINTSESAKLVVTAMTAFKLSAADLPKIADIFAGFANQTVLDAGDLGLALAAVGPVAKSSGLALNDFAGYMATLAQGGFRSMSDAGTSLKTVLLNLQAPSTTAAKAMAQVGLNTYDANGRLLPFRTSLENLRKSLSGLSDQEKNNVLLRIFGQDGIRAATILLKESQSAIDGNIESIEKQGDAAGVAKTRLQTYQGAVAQLGAKFEALRIEIGEKLLPIGTKVVEFFSSGVDGLRSMANNTQTLMGYLIPLVGVLVTLTGPAIVAGLGAIATAIGACAAASAAWVAANPFGIVAIAVGALALKVNALYSEIQQIYDQVDEGESKSQEALLKRVEGLRKAGDELSLTKAKYLLAVQRQSDAEQGTLTGVNFFGERTYSVDPEEVKRTQQRVAELREELTKLQFEAGRRGAAGAKSTNDATGIDPAVLERQSQALTTLQDHLTSRLDAADSGVPPRMAAKIGQIEKAYAKLGKQLQEAFGGNLNNKDYLKGVAQLEAAQRQEIARLRATAATAAATAARESALKVQKAELDAMVEGRAKRAAQRDLDVAEIERSTKEEADKYKDFPARRAQIEEDGRRIIAAKRRGWATEDQQLAQESADRVAEAQRAAESAQVAAMEEGRAKREAVRAQELEDLRQTIAERVKALTGDPEAQASVQASGNTEIAAKEREQARARVAEEKTAQQQVTEARRAAHDAEIAAIADEGQRRAAERQRDIEGVQESVQERVKALEGYPELQASVIADGERQVRALREKAAQDDQKDARDRARRIADAWITAQAAQAEAQAAGREAESAAFELRLSRRLALVKENGVAVAQLEADAVGERARLAAQAAQAQYGQDQRQLEVARDKALEDDQLSASERQAIWSTYYGNLGKLSAAFQAGERTRLQQREEADRQAAENLRLARITAANAPVEQSTGRVQELQASRELALTDAEALQINRQISAERAGQITALQGQLLGLGGVILTTKEREAVEARIRALQREQTTAVRDQEEAQRKLQDSVLGRLEAEAQYAERSARTFAEQTDAQRRQLAVAQTRLRGLDTRIAGEGREEQRNELLGQRYTLLGQIEDLEMKIGSAGAEGDARRLALYRAQAQEQLTLAGLGEDQVAASRLAAELAGRDLATANERVALARTEAELQAALLEQSGARVAFAQALAAQETAGREAQARTLTKEAEGLQQAADARERGRQTLREQLTLENSLQDATEARTSALLRIQGLSDDAQASAERELQATRDRLALTGRQLETVPDGDGRAELLRTRIDLLGQLAEQERKVQAAREARLVLGTELAQAEVRLSRSLSGGTGEALRLVQATDAVSEAREDLTRAEREYGQARRAYDVQAGTTNAQRLKDATDRLTGAVTAHRSAIHGLADEYHQIIGDMDGVRLAADQLRQAVQGDQPEGPVDTNREIDRFYAIERRREAARLALAQGVKQGDAAEIARLTTSLAEQEKRYRDQQKVLARGGVNVSLSNTKQVQDLLSSVDSLGIGFDREAAALDERARIADREAQAVATFAGGTERFASSTDALIRALDESSADLGRSLRQAGDDAGAERNVQTLVKDLQKTASDLTSAARTGPTYTPEQLDQMAQAFASRVKLPELRLPSAQELVRAQVAALPSIQVIPAVSPSPVAGPVTYVTDVGGLTIYQQPGESADALANRVIGKLEDRARRAGRAGCPPGRR